MNDMDEIRAFTDQVLNHARRPCPRRNRMAETTTFIEHAAATVADLHAEQVQSAMRKPTKVMTRADWLKVAELKPRQVWRTALHQADIRFGSSNVNIALVTLGRTRSLF